MPDKPDEPEELPYTPPPLTPEEIEAEEAIYVPVPPDPTEEYVPPPPKPIPVQPVEVDVKDLAQDLLKEAMDYAKASINEIAKGHTVDVLNPTITSEDITGKELVIADAKSRSWRTLVQGLIVDVLFAIAAAIAVLTGMDPFVRETWIAFGFLLLKSVASAVISYLMRLKVTPTIKVPGEKMAVMPVPRPMLEEQEGA
jgi:hypothetical protein